MLAVRLRFKKQFAPLDMDLSQTQDVFLRNMFELLVLLMQLRRTGMEILMGDLDSVVWWHVEYVE